MAVTINASTSAGLVQTADTTGNLSLQSNGTTIAALTSTGLAVTGAGSFSTTLAVTGAATLSSTLALGTSGMTVTGSATAWGFGVAPSVWTNGYLALEVKAKGNSMFSSSQTDNSIGANLYYNNGFKFAGTGYASFYTQDSGSHVWLTSSASGTAGNAATMTTLMSISAAGAVTIPGTLGVTGTITPGQTTGIVGTTTNNNAQAGSVGEYVASVITTYTNFPATGVFGDLTSISLTAGDWDVSLSFGAYSSAAVNWNEVLAFIGTASGNSSVNFVPNDSGQYFGFARSTTSITELSLVVPAYRVSISSTATYYLKMYADYTSGGPPIAKGRISARRVR